MEPKSKKKKRKKREEVKREKRQKRESFGFISCCIHNKPKPNIWHYAFIPVWKEVAKPSKSQTATLYVWYNTEQ